MRISIFLTISLFCFWHSYAQNDNCVLNYYSGNNDIVNAYNTYKIGVNINLDSLIISKSELEQIISSVKDSIVVEAINGFKRDSSFMQFQLMHLKTDHYEGSNYSDFLECDDSSSISELYKRNTIIENHVGQFLNKFNLLNLSIFYYDTTESADLYIYEKGYFFHGIFEVNFKMMSNPMLYSVLKHYYEEVNFLDYNDDIIGFENAVYTQNLFVPIVVKGEYICDLRMVFCK